MTNFKVPVWGYWMMGIGLAAFIGLLVAYLHKNRGFRRPIFASPYVLWIIVFTVIPCLLVAYFSFTDPQGNFTLDNFKSFRDSNYATRQALDPETLKTYEDMGLSLEDLGLARNAITISTLVFSLWMGIPIAYTFLKISPASAALMLSASINTASRC